MILSKAALYGLGCLVLLLCQGGGARAAEVSVTLRDFPYPFTNMVAFASDSDTQKAEHSIAIHRLFNERLGLPISDSVFPLGSTVSSFFRGPHELNKDKEGNLPAFAVLLREWHRGNIDHFHSWNENQSPRVRTPAAKGRLLKDRLSLDMNMIKLPFRKAGSYNVLRVRFSDLPPEDLKIELYFEGNERYTVTEEEVKQARLAQFRTDSTSGVIIDILAPNVDGQRVDFSRLKRIEFLAPSCGSACRTSILELARDEFSRRVALLHAAKFEQWNIRPFLYTSHGGATNDSTFGPEEAVLNEDIARDPDNDPEISSLAAKEKSHSYLVDVLKRLGVGSVWPLASIPDVPYINNMLYGTRSDIPGPMSIFGFHLNRRTWSEMLSSGKDTESYKERILDKYPELSRGFVDDIVFCKNALLCGAEQGTVIGLLPEISLQEIKKRSGVDHLWYTHFGTALAFGAPDFEPTLDQPFPTASQPPFARLSDHYYNFSGQVRQGHRVWVAPANTVERYRRMRQQVSGHVRLDRQTQTVRIEPWVDPVLEVLVPEAVAGTRDLHGLTVYVDDAKKARVRIGEREIDSFTRNPADETGRESVTIIDDNTPTALIGAVPLEKTGVVFANSGFDPRTKNHDKEKTIEADRDGRASLIIIPNHLELWNTSHLKFRYRKTAPGRAYVNLLLDDGQLLSLREGLDFESTADAGWTITEATPGSWATAMVSTVDTTWRSPREVEELLMDKERLPLPLGRIRQVEIGLIGAVAGARLSVDYLHALRPSGNGTDPEGRKLVAGRVANGDSQPVRNTTVVAVDGSGRQHLTTTDEDGLYFFSGQAKGTRLQLSLQGSACYPERGSEVEILKDEVELDFDTSRCDYSSLLAESMQGSKRANDKDGVTR